jgi:hypothetical protein
MFPNRSSTVVCRSSCSAIVTHQIPLADFQQGIDLVASGAQSINVTQQPT